MYHQERLSQHLAGKRCCACHTGMFQHLSLIGVVVVVVVVVYRLNVPLDTIIGHFGDDFYRPYDQTNSVKALN